MNIILLGAPGAGKGSQAAKLKEYYDIPHISTGDAFRSNIARGTEIGIYAKSFMDKGQLVPDDVVVRIVAARLAEDDCKKGFLLDGFPRNLFQAQELDKFSKVDAVIDIQIDLSLLMDRLCGRRVCKNCGESYHINFLGGKTTCLGLAIEQMPTHVAGLPAAVNVSCHVTRRATAEL